ncbi:MAG: aminotransferase class V-fold PLP-dependent enzyme, partial [Burkholderiales bacterium]|nr:aminotransferase class V-fold PLP-dependent enzyme [Burkholderiales bacterium]
MNAIVAPDRLAVLDVERIRADFPVLHNVHPHGRPLVYLDNAASSQMPQPVIDRLVRYQTHEHANIHRGVHTLSQVATEAYEGARRSVQRFLNATEDREIVFTTGCTEAVNLVMHGWGRRFLQAGDEVILTHLEHHSNIVPWQMLRDERGIVLKVVPIDDDGAVDVDTFAALFTERTRFCALTHVSNALGTIVPVARMIEIAHAHGAKVLVDGAQAAPHLPVDVQALDCDFYCFSGHKVCGPTGSGALYGKAALLEQMQPFKG